LLEINKALVSETRRKKLLELILDQAIELTGAERGFALLKGDETPSVEASRSIDHEEVRDARAKVSMTVVRRVLASGEPVLTDNAAEDAEFSGQRSISDLKLRSILCVPLCFKDQPLGCLYLDNRFQKGIFGEEAQRLLELFADQAALAVWNARLHEENRAAAEALADANRRLEERVEHQQIEIATISEELNQQRVTVRLKYDYSSLIGDSQAMREIFRLMDIVTDTDYPVLIQGESGTGKELVARAIHYHGRRAGKNFVSENCAAISESLLESELFGYVKGAFTGANTDKKGLFELAEGGTLFLDEIGEMDPKMQKKLLRVLQDGEFRKVGGRENLRVSVRIISATNADLARMIGEGTFRSDLFYRLKVMTIRMPPLRERREDIPRLVDHFLGKVAKDRQTEKRAVSDEAMRVLMAHSWPGNVRELENEILRLATLCPDKITGADVRDLTQRAVGSEPGRDIDLGGKTMEDIERDAILQALKRAGGRKVQAARALGIPRRTFYNRLKKLGLM
jgi:transcriptional regulator with GAF, ATPase, and Fis domain